METLYTFADLRGHSPKRLRELFGGKGLGLFQAERLGISVPQTWLISTQLYELFLLQSDSGEHFLKQHLETTLKQLPDLLYAVRSSSQMEDSFEHSFAGIFQSELNVSRQSLIPAIAKVWNSCLSLKVDAYLGSGSASMKMAVILQPMVAAKYAGVCFSKHPSPSSILESQDIVIEFAATSGEKIVQGEITPLRLTGSVDHLLGAVDLPWIPALLGALMKLKEEYQHEIDAEFVVDHAEQFWLVQQRPISKEILSRVVDLSHYKRKYKRSLCSLDVELLIDGCSQFLGHYLELPYQFERWMIMISNAEGTQELWMHEVLDQAMIEKVAQKISEEKGYEERLEERYRNHHRALREMDYASFFDRQKPLDERFFQWCEWITPFCAHYYVPMFLIDALYLLLKHQMQQVDRDNAEGDLFQLGIGGISSLMDLLKEELQEGKPLADLSRKYGFLKCHQPYEKGYTEEDLLELKALGAPPPEVETEWLNELSAKYISTERRQYLLEKFRVWMSIRNQEMEYLMYAYLQSRPLFEELAEVLDVSVKQLWSSSKEAIQKGVRAKEGQAIRHFSSANLTILRKNGRTRLLHDLIVQGISPSHLTFLRGKTIFGKGTLKARVRIAYRPDQVQALSHSEEPLVLVTGMTTPDFIPILKKSFAALVTDEGGILCHAAILAREIPISCIVGTGQATTLLKENQFVLIHFDTGEIKPLS